MSKPQPFVVPAGVTFQITDAGVVIENEGDIVLHTNFGRALTRIVSTAGSITVHAPVDGGTLHAAGDVSVHGAVRVEALNAGGNVDIGGDASITSARVGGDLRVNGNANADLIGAGGAISVSGAAVTGAIDAGGGISVAGDLTATTVRSGGTIDLGGAVKADGLYAAVVRLSGPTATVRGIQGANAVHIGPAKLQVDAVIAPEVHVDPRTNGRVTVIESQNDLGPNAIKGGFRLVDYAETFGDPAPFLAERGLVPLGEGVTPPEVVSVPAPPPVAVAVAVAAVAAEVAAPAVEPEPAPVIERPSLAEGAGGTLYIEEPEPTEGVSAADRPEPEPTPSEEPVELEPEPEPEPEAAPAAEVAAAPSVSEVAEHPLHKQLLEAVTRIAESYAEAELPPAVSHLMNLIQTRAYDQVRAEITSIWSDLLKYHQKKGLRIQHQVTTTFNTINSLVKKM